MFCLTQNMQAEYVNKVSPTYWDRVHIQPRVRKFPATGESSETTARRSRPPPEVLYDVKSLIPEVTYYDRDYNVTNQLTRSQTSEDFGYKSSERQRFNKHTAWAENNYIYPPYKRLTDQPPLCNIHGSSQMRSAYKIPTFPPTLVTDKDQHKHTASLPPDPVMSVSLPLKLSVIQPVIEPSWHKDLEPLDTTHEGYEKYLDPYLTTSRLHHRPYTTEQLRRISVTRDIVTYHTLSKDPWVRTQKPNHDNWRQAARQIKLKYDRESIRKDSTFSLPKEHVFREIITHNKPKWAPGTFRTEVRDNYVSPLSQPTSGIQNFEELVQSYYRRGIAQLQTNMECEHSTTREFFASETSQIGTGKPMCAVIDQFKEKNKRLQLKKRTLAS